MSNATDDYRALLTKTGGPGVGMRKPQDLGGSLYVSICREAWQAAGIDVENPREVQEHWFPEEDCVVIDLNP